MAREKIKQTVDETVDETDDVFSALAPSVDAKRRKAIEKVAQRFKRWRPACEELTLVCSVPTCFVQLDRATRCGGFPIERITTVHGPSGMGKTTFTIGLILSFLIRDHLGALVDAEYTTPFDFVRKLMGEYATHPGFFAKRPDSYEETVNAVREFCTNVADAREDGSLDEDTSGIVVVDSIRKLIPKNLLAMLLKVSKDDSPDMLTGRAGQVKAQMNQAWIDEMTPLLAKTRTALVLIAREFDKEGATADDRMYDKAWAVAGGRALIFDASLVIRITRAAWVTEGSKENAKVIGERHRIRLWKTKVEGHEGKYVDAYFHTSNGQLAGVPEGLDRPRDVLELALHYGIVEQSGNWFNYGGQRIGQGTNNAVRTLHANPELCVEIENKVRQEFRPDEVLEGGVEE